MVNDASELPPEGHPRVLATLLELCRRAREAEDTAELAFLLVNDSFHLSAYRQAALWFAEGGIRALSGVVEPEANAPYVQWLEKLIQARLDKVESPCRLDSLDIPDELLTAWSQWLPAHALWLPLTGVMQDGVLSAQGGLILAREVAWRDDEIELLKEWLAAWRHAWLAKFKPSPWNWRSLQSRLINQFKQEPGVTWWRQRRLRWLAAIVAVTLFPIRLTVLAPAELVPANPTLIRAPLDGVIDGFQVKPNEKVAVGQVLLNFDEAPLKSRLAVAQQALTSAEAEYRQAAQLAVSDSRQKAFLASLAAKIDERKAESDYLEGQLERSRITAPQPGIALFDDPSEWIGRPVVTGERIMRIAAPDDVEIEAWVNVGDAIPLEDGASASLYLNASPLNSVSANVRYMAHEAMQRPDGQYAYRVRARLDGATTHRVGLKGTAKLAGGWVPLVYWVLRRPMATIRQTIGW